MLATHAEALRADDAPSSSTPERATSTTWIWARASSSRGCARWASPASTRSSTTATAGPPTATTSRSPSWRRRSARRRRAEAAVRPGDRRPSPAPTSTTRGAGIGELDGHGASTSQARCRASGWRPSSNTCRATRRRPGPRLAKVDAPSPARRPPACRAFGACGGCVLQHFDYASQLDWKRAARERGASPRAPRWRASQSTPASPRRERSDTGTTRSWSSRAPTTAAGWCWAPTRPGPTKSSISRAAGSPNRPSTRRRPRCAHSWKRRACARTTSGRRPATCATSSCARTTRARCWRVWIARPSAPRWASAGAPFSRRPPGGRRRRRAPEPDARQRPLRRRRRRQRARPGRRAGPSTIDRRRAADVRLTLSPGAFFQANRDGGRASHTRAIARGLAMRPADRVVDAYSRRRRHRPRAGARGGEVVGIESHAGAVADATASAGSNGIAQRALPRRRRRRHAGDHRPRRPRRPQPATQGLRARRARRGRPPHAARDRLSLVRPRHAGARSGPARRARLPLRRGHAVRHAPPHAARRGPGGRLRRAS